MNQENTGYRADIDADTYQRALDAIIPLERCGLDGVVPVNAVRLPCGHVYCKLCLQDIAITAALVNQEPPVCKTCGQPFQIGLPTLEEARERNRRNTDVAFGWPDEDRVPELGVQTLGTRTQQALSMGPGSSLPWVPPSGRVKHLLEEYTREGRARANTWSAPSAIPLMDGPHVPATPSPADQVGTHEVESSIPDAHHEHGEPSTVHEQQEVEDQSAQQDVVHFDAPAQSSATDGQQQMWCGTDQQNPVGFVDLFDFGGQPLSMWQVDSEWDFDFSQLPQDFFDLEPGHVDPFADAMQPASLQKTEQLSEWRGPDFNHNDFISGMADDPYATLAAPAVAAAQIDQIGWQDTDFSYQDMIPSMAVATPTAPTYSPIEHPVLSPLPWSTTYTQARAPTQDIAPAYAQAQHDSPAFAAPSSQTPTANPLTSPPPQHPRRLRPLLPNLPTTPSAAATPASYSSPGGPRDMSVFSGDRFCFKGYLPNQSAMEEAVKANGGLISAGGFKHTKYGVTGGGWKPTDSWRRNGVEVLDEAGFWALLERRKEERVRQREEEGLSPAA